MFVYRPITDGGHIEIQYGILKSNMAALWRHFQWRHRTCYKPGIAVRILPISAYLKSIVFF
jgi:hypothetical protein